MVKSVYASNATTPQTCGSRGVMYRKYCFQSATQEGTAIKLTLRRNSRTLPYLVNDMPMRREDSKHPCFCDPFHVCVKCVGAEEPKNLLYFKHPAPSYLLLTMPIPV